MAGLEKITEAVTNNANVEASAVSAIQLLAGEVKELATRDTVDPAEVSALADKINGNAAALAAAITANTPADPAKGGSGAPSGSAPAAGSTATAPTTGQ